MPYAVKLVWTSLGMSEDVADIKDGCVVAAPGKPKLFSSKEAAQDFSLKVMAALKDNPNPHRTDVLMRP